MELFSEGERIMTVIAFLLFAFAFPRDTVTGTILDTSGAAISGARIEISAANVSRVTFSDDSGSFSIIDAPAGDYTLRIAANGFATYTSAVRLPADSLKLTLRVAPH